MKRAIYLMMALAAGTAAGVTGGEAQSADRPDLVVMISVDQLRGDLLERYDAAFTGGFRRLADGGHRFTSASHAHAITHTAPGHATLSTGVFPSRSGIVANSWQQRTGDSWAPMYAVEDVDSPILGFETVEQLPGRSPKNLLRTGLADWVRAADPEARTVSISSKDRAAITMAGQTTDNVFWLLPQLARYITSTFYADQYPAWLERFNREVMPAIAAELVWDSETPDRFRGLARDDEGVPFEGDGVHTTFPHNSSDEAGDGQQRHNAWGFGQSRADKALLELAKAATEEFDLGGRGHVDYLAISLSATDYVGHGYGPLSQEQLSNLIHLDRELGVFFDYLDDTVGEGRWLVGLSGDHGVVTMPEASRAMGHPDAERILSGERSALLESVRKEVMVAGGTAEEIAARLARRLEDDGVVQAAYTHDELTVEEPADSFAVLFRNSHYPGRAHHSLSPYGVEVRYGNRDLVSGETGTTHGSPYWYDRHVPFILYGPGVDRGVSGQAVYTVDLAPTLAALAGIATPDDLDGNPVINRQ